MISTGFRGYVACAICPDRRQPAVPVGDAEARPSDGHWWRRPDNLLLFHDLPCERGDGTQVAEEVGPGGPCVSSRRRSRSSASSCSGRGWYERRRRRIACAARTLMNAEHIRGPDGEETTRWACRRIASGPSRLAWERPSASNARASAGTIDTSRRRRAANRVRGHHVDTMTRRADDRRETASTTRIRTTAGRDLVSSGSQRGHPSRVGRRTRISVVHL